MNVWYLSPHALACNGGSWRAINQKLEWPGLQMQQDLTRVILTGFLATPNSHYWYITLGSKPFWFSAAASAFSGFSVVAFRGHWLRWWVQHLASIWRRPNWGICRPWGAEMFGAAAVTGVTGVFLVDKSSDMNVLVMEWKLLLGFRDLAGLQVLSIAEHTKFSDGLTQLRKLVTWKSLNHVTAQSK